jgi:heme-degrading monooxygenase HmoA
MYSAAFIFEPGDYDAEFHRLNDEIKAVAQSLPGYMGVEQWQSADGRRRNATYYWSDLDTLKRFSTHPAHLEAKRQYARWYKGYRIVVAEVLRSYGDAGFGHLTPNERARPDAT